MNTFFFRIRFLRRSGVSLQASARFSRASQSRPLIGWGRVMVSLWKGEERFLSRCVPLKPFRSWQRCSENKEAVGLRLRAFITSSFTLLVFL